MRFSFSVRLLKESLRRLRTVGVTAFLLTFFFSVMSPASLLTDHLFFDLDAKSVQIIEAPNFALPLLVLLLLSPLFAFVTLSFLNQRSHSDFYHALPYTRLSLFVHFLLGAFVWQGMIITVCMGVRAILYAVNPYTVFGISAVLHGIAVYAVALLLYTGLASLACSASGSMLSSLFSFSTLVLLLPSCGDGIKRLISDLIPLIDTSAGVWDALGWDTFWPVRLFLSSLGSSSSFVRPSMVLSSLAVALLSLVLAGWIFCRRRSESAGFATGEPVFNYAIGTAFALIVGMLIMFQGSAEILGILVMMVAYLLYQLITLRRRSKFFRAAKWCFVAPTVALLILGAAYLWRGHLLRHLPSAEQITSVTLAEEDGGQDFFSPERDSTFEDIMLSRLRLDNPDFAALISEALKDNARLMESGKLYEYGTVEEGYFHTPLRLTVRRKGGLATHYVLYVTNEVYEKIREIMADDPVYMEAYAKLPSNNEMILVSTPFSNVNLKDSIWPIFCEEYATLTDRQKTEVKGRSLSDPCSLVVSGSVAGKSFCSTYSVPPYMLRTRQAIVTRVNSETVRLPGGELYRSYEALRMLLSDQQIAVSMESLSVQVNSVGDIPLYAYTDYGYKNWTALSSALLSYMNEDGGYDVQPDTELVHLTVYCMQYEDGYPRSANFTVVLSVSPTEAEQIVSLFQ